MLRPARALSDVSAPKMKKLKMTVIGLLMLPRMLKDVGDRAVLDKVPATLIMKPATQDTIMTSQPCTFRVFISARQELILSIGTAIITRKGSPSKF